MENYFFLAEQFRTQDEPTFCGLTTLAMVLNSLRIDPMRTWKGAWRWFNEQNLACCTSADEVRQAGLSFDMFRCLAGCNGAAVQAQRAPTLSEGNEVTEAFLETFRSAVRAVSRSQERECLVVCYSREALGQTGAGHFSPVGGYHEASDSVLILDVARFKYPPHWAPLRDVAKGMFRIDPDTGKPRGYLHLRMQERADTNSQPRDMLPPLRVPYVAPAAGRHLSEVLTAALSADAANPTTCPAGAKVPFASSMRRWLAASAVAEHQVLGQLLQVGNSSALQEVFARLSQHKPFVQLCEAYEAVANNLCEGRGAEFPPLHFFKAELRRNIHVEADLSLQTCGELWVLLLLLMPEHIRRAVSPELAGIEVSQGVTRAVRGPWGLPLEALREALSHTLPEARRNCQSQTGRTRVEQS